MLKLLVPVDGSDASQRAVDHVATKMQWYKDGAEIHLINAQPPLPYGGRVSSLISHDKVDEYHKEEGMTALQPARQKLDAAGIKYHYHIAVGEPAEVIVRYAKQHGVDQVVMGTRGRGAVSSVLLGSVATKVLAMSEVPVVLVK